MFLQRIVLENVRSIEHLELPFIGPDGGTRKWTFLLGENGTGKSTVLRSIALILAGSEALPELIGVSPEAWIRHGKQECTIHADLVTAGGEKRSIDFRLRRGQNIKEIFEENKESLDDLDSALRHTARSYMTIGYGVSRRLSSEKSLGAAKNEAFRHPRAQSVATLFSADASLNPLEAWAMDLDYRRKDGLNVIRKSLDKLLPGVRFLRIDKERRELLFHTADGDLPLAQMSDGYQNVAAWCGDLLYRVSEVFADHKDPLAARGLLLIDEIDLHLHPLWKRQLVDFLGEKLKNFQIIATTHSALTVHQAGEGELFVLKREAPDQPPRLIAYPGAPRTLLLHQLLMSPIFGLETADSRPVEGMKKEYQELRDKRSRTPAEKARLGRLKTELQDLPEWTRPTPAEKKRLALLEKIDQALGGNGSAAKGTKRGSRKGAKKGSRATTGRK
ncbi:MAG TPA: AAA family ATPase [Pyrinomonadaceae bacterium]|nr:AAA family ATPase [Pyrinomonadaceae bacterium]